MPNTDPVLPKQYIGSLTAFDPNTVNFSTWWELLENYCDLNDISDKSLQKKILLNYIGLEAYNILRTTLLPTKPSSKTLDELQILLKDHYEPTTLKFSSISKFEARIQQTNETIATYVRELRILANECQFETTLQDRLLVKFVNGLKCPNLKRRLWSTSNLTLDIAIKTATQEEAVLAEIATDVNKVNSKKSKFSQPQQRQQHQNQVNRSAKSDQRPRPRYNNANKSKQSYSQSDYQQQRQSSYHQQQVNQNKSPQFVNQRQSVNPQTTQPCWRCTRFHNPNFCPARNWKCNNCGKIGHTSKSRTCNQVKAVEQEVNLDDYTFDDIIIGKISDSTFIDHQSTFSEILSNLQSQQKQCRNSENSDSVIPWPVVKNDNNSLIKSDCLPNQCLNTVFEKSVTQWPIKNFQSEMSISPSQCIKSVSIINTVNRQVSSPPFLVNFNLSGVQVQCEIDTGAGSSIMSLQEFSSKFPDRTCYSCTQTFKGVDGNPLDTVGEAFVKVYYNRKNFYLRLVIIRFNKITHMLLGREWLDSLVPDWRRKLFGDDSILSVKSEENNFVIKFRAMYPKVFSTDRSSSIKGVKARLVLKENAIPVFHKSYDIPYSIRDEVEKIIRKMVNDKLLIPVTQSEWASPVWPVPKKDGSLRLVVDFRKTVNPLLRIDHYPLPRLEDIWVTLSGCSVFTKIDLSDAYMQLEVTEDCQELLTINTPWGLFRFVRLSFGIANGPAIFQSTAEQILAGLKQVGVFIDDIFVGGKSFDDCFNRTNQVLKRLNERNVRGNIVKSLWLVPEVDCLGHLLDEKGIHPLQNKVTAILEARPPVNVQELRSFLGLVNFYNHFLPHLSSTLHPLHKLLEKGEKFQWSPECDLAFTLAKQKLVDNKLLVLYNPSLPMYVYSDASPYGVGATFCHLIKNEEKPVMFASASLTKSQRNYSQLDREALAVIFAVKKFHKYLLGREFTIVTDNSPLKSILNPQKGIPIIASPRMQRWSIILSAYNYKIEHRKSKFLAPADALSRLPLDVFIKEVNVNDQIVIMPDIPLNSAIVADETEKDPLLQKVYLFVLNGWPPSVSPDIKPYFLLREYLSLEEGCVLFGNRVVVPQKLQDVVLNMLHECHPGVVRMKMLARKNTWWPTQNNDIELKLKMCEPCQIENFRPCTNRTSPWEKVEQPWDRVHLDYFYFLGYHFLILEDAFSKWIDVWSVKSTDANQLLSKLRKHIASHGNMVQIVTDNGPPYDSYAFIHFCTQNNIIVTKSPPYHPKSQGQIERAVQTVKKVLKKLVLEVRNEKGNRPSLYILKQKLANFLLIYRNTPTTATNKCPSEQILKHMPRTNLSNLNPKETLQVKNLPKFEVGDKVLVRINKEVQKATIIQKLSPTCYYVDVQGTVKLCHLNQLKVTSLSNDLNYQPPTKSANDFNYQPPVNTSVQQPDHETGNQSNNEHEGNREIVPNPPILTQNKPAIHNEAVRKSNRNRKKPEKLNL